MKRVLLLCTLCLLGACSLSDEPRELRVMTYNIAAARMSSLEEIGAFMRSHDCDLIALQEIDSMTRRPGHEPLHDKNFMDTLARLTGLYPLYGQAIDHAGGKYGIGLLSRWPYLLSRKTFLPKANPAEETRVLLEAVVDLGDGDTILFACTHIDFSTPETRTPQIALVDKLLRESSYPVIVGGDFNSLIDSPEMAPMMAWQALSGADFSVTADAPTATIDFLFGWPAGRWSLVQTQVDHTLLSDHLPVTSTVLLK